MPQNEKPPGSSPEGAEAPKWPAGELRTESGSSIEQDFIPLSELKPAPEPISFQEGFRRGLTIEHVLISVSVISTKESAGQFDDSIAGLVERGLKEYRGVKAVGTTVLYQHGKIEQHADNCVCHYCLQGKADTVIPGGWTVGQRCWFTRPDLAGWLPLGRRRPGEIQAYDPMTNLITVAEDGIPYTFEHTQAFGGISGRKQLDDR